MQTSVTWTKIVRWSRLPGFLTRMTACPVTCYSSPRKRAPGRSARPRRSCPARLAAAPGTARESTNELEPRTREVRESRIRDVRVCHPDEAVLFPRLAHRDGADLVRIGRTNGGVVRTDSPGVVCAHQLAVCIHASLGQQRASMGAVAQGGSSLPLGVPEEHITFAEDGELAHSALLELVRFEDGMGIPEHVRVN
jgi:hypothetical protein